MVYAFWQHQNLIKIFTPCEGPSPLAFVFLPLHLPFPYQSDDFSSQGLRFSQAASLFHCLGCCQSVKSYAPREHPKSVSFLFVFLPSNFWAPQIKPCQNPITTVLPELYQYIVSNLCHSIGALFLFSLIRPSTSPVGLHWDLTSVTSLITWREFGCFPEGNTCCHGGKAFASSSNNEK